MSKFQFGPLTPTLFFLSALMFNFQFGLLTPTQKFVSAFKLLTWGQCYKENLLLVTPNTGLLNF